MDKNKKIPRNILKRSRCSISILPRSFITRMSVYSVAGIVLAFATNTKETARGLKATMATVFEPRAKEKMIVFINSAVGIR